MWKLLIQNDGDYGDCGNISAILTMKTVDSIIRINPKLQVNVSNPAGNNKYALCSA